MKKSNQFEASSPLATVEEIQKRLARPSLHSQSSSSFVVSSHRKLEDYLHPVLLSTVRAKIGGKRKIVGEVMKARKKNEAKEFDRFDELRNFTGGSKAEEKRMERNEVVDLNCDSDSIGGGGGGGGGEDGSDEEEEQVECTPFRRFEKTALKRFKG